METLSTDFRYWAFVSYSSNDKSWGRWLHRAIESYGIPAQLVNNLTPAGHPAPKRFRPSFRDREELPASADLSTQIEDALRSSRYLIVVCSKHAAQSRWVNKEIEIFQRLDRNNHILAIIVDGEPNAGDERECFPPALRKCEPIAADARPDGDGKANAKLKLIAGMLGVSFDALKQRDVHRRTSRMQIVLCLSLLLTTAFASLSWYANHQRVIAVERRVIAVERLVDLRGLISKLLWGLVDNFDVLPGPLTYKDALLTGAEAYLSELVEEDQDDKGLKRELAITYEKIGGVRLDQGRLTDARKSYDLGLVIAQQLAKRDVSNASYQIDVASNYLGMGTVFLLQGKLTEAKVQFLTGLDFLQRLRLNLPKYEPFQRSIARIYQGLALVHYEQGNTEKALWSLDESRNLYELLVRSNPKNASYAIELAATYNQFANLLSIKPDINQAIQYGQKSISLCDRVLQDLPYHQSGLQALAIGHIELSKANLEKGEITASSHHAEEGVKLLQRLHISDPMSAITQLDLAKAWITHAIVLRTMNRIEKSAEQLFKAKKSSGQVFQIDPSNAAARAVDAMACGQLVITLRMSGRMVEAQSFNLEFFELFRAMRDNNLPLNIQLQQLKRQIEGLSME
jgi:tetratricopeptide (TPR) repeat protein